MAVLSEIAQSKQTTQIGGIAQGRDTVGSTTKIQESSVDNKTASLIKDLTGSAKSLYGSYIDATDYVSKRITTDRKIELQNSLEEVDAHYDTENGLYYKDVKFDSSSNRYQPYGTPVELTASHMSEKTVLEYDSFDKINKNISLGGNGNEIVKDNFVSPANLMLSERSVNNRKVEKKLALNSNTKLVKDQSSAIKLGYLSKNDIEGMVNSSLSLGEKKENVIGLIAASRIYLLAENSEAKIKELVNPNGEYDENKVDEILDKEFNPLLEMMTTETVDGKVVDKYATTRNAMAEFKKKAKELFKSESDKKNTLYMSKAKDIINTMTHIGEPYPDEQGITHYFEKDHKKFAEKSSDYLLLLTGSRPTKEQSLKIMNTWKEEVDKKTSQGIVEFTSAIKKINDSISNNIVPAKESISDLRAKKEIYDSMDDVSSANKDSMRIQIEDFERKYNSLVSAKQIVSESFNPKMTTDQINKLKEQVNNGFVTDKNIEVKSSDLKASVKEISDKHGTLIRDIDVSEKNDKGVNIGEYRFTEALNMMGKSVMILGNEYKPTVFSEYDKLYTNSLVSFGSVNDAKKALIYNEHRKNNGDKSLVFAEDIKKTLMDILNRDFYEGEKKLEGDELERARLDVFDTTRKKFVTNMFENETFIAFKEELDKDIIPGIASGEHALLVGLDAEPSLGMKDAIYKKAIKEGNINNMTSEQRKEYVYGLNYGHAGGNLPAMMSQSDVVFLMPDGGEEKKYQKVIDHIVETEATGYWSVSIHNEYLSGVNDPVTEQPYSDVVVVIKRDGVNIAQLTNSSVEAYLSKIKNTPQIEIEMKRIDAEIKYNKARLNEMTLEGTKYDASNADIRDIQKNLNDLRTKKANIRKSTSKSKQNKEGKNPYGQQ